MSCLNIERLLDLCVWRSEQVYQHHTYQQADQYGVCVLVSPCVVDGAMSRRARRPVKSNSSIKSRRDFSARPTIPFCHIRRIWSSPWCLDSQSPPDVVLCKRHCDWPKFGWHADFALFVNRWSFLHFSQRPPTSPSAVHPPTPGYSTLARMNHRRDHGFIAILQFRRLLSG